MFMTAKKLVLSGIGEEYHSEPSFRIKKYLFTRFYDQDFDDPEKTNIIKWLRSLGSFGGKK